MSVEHAPALIASADEHGVHRAERLGEAPARRVITHGAKDLDGPLVGGELLLARERAYHERIDDEVEESHAGGKETRGAEARVEGQSEAFPGAHMVEHFVG